MGSLPRMTSELRGTMTGATPSPSWLWMMNVSGAIRVGSSRVLVWVSVCAMRRQCAHPVDTNLQPAYQTDRAQSPWSSTHAAAEVDDGAAGRLAVQDRGEHRVEVVEPDVVADLVETAGLRSVAIRPTPRGGDRSASSPSRCRAGSRRGG